MPPRAAADALQPQRAPLQLQRAPLQAQRAPLQAQGVPMQPQLAPLEPQAPARPVKKLSPIDGTIQWVVKGDTNDEAARAWGASSGMGKYTPSVPQARDALRAEGRASGTRGHGFAFEHRGGPPARPAVSARPRSRSAQFGDEV